MCTALVRIQITARLYRLRADLIDANQKQEMERREHLLIIKRKGYHALTVRTNLDKMLGVHCF